MISILTQVGCQKKQKQYIHLSCEGSKASPSFYNAGMVNTCINTQDTAGGALFIHIPTAGPRGVFVVEQLMKMLMC